MATTRFNYGYGRLADGVLTYAPRRLNPCDGTLPTEAQYLAAGWLKIAPATPPTEEGYTFTPDGWEVASGQISRTWTRTVTPAPVKTYSKLRIVVAAKSAGVWANLAAWITSAGYDAEWSAAQNFASNYEGFDAIKAAIVASGVATSAQVDAILAAAEVSEE